MKNNRKVLLEQIGITKKEEEIWLGEWDNISENMQLSEEFIREFKDEVNWFSISLHQELSEKFIREFENCVHWKYISAKQLLSESFIREYQIMVDWKFIMERQKLSYEFIHEFENNIDWAWVSEYGKSSIDFLLEFQNRIDWEIYFSRQSACYQIIKQFIFKTSHRSVRSIKTFHLTTNQKNEIEKLLRLKYLFAE